MLGRVYFYKLKDDKRKAVSEQSWKHEQDCGDLYVSLMRAGLLQDWIHTSDQKSGFRFDRGATINNQALYFEIERGTQTIAAIEEKIASYLKLPGRFHVIFTVQDYRPNPFESIDKTAKQFGADILKLLTRYKRGSQFLVAPHHLLTSSPTSPVLVSPENKAYSFHTIQNPIQNP